MTKPKIKTITLISLWVRRIESGARERTGRSKSVSTHTDRIYQEYFICGYILRCDRLLCDPFRREKSVNFECRNVEIGLSRLRVERTTSFLRSVIASRDAKVKSRKCQRLFISIDGNRSDTHKKYAKFIRIRWIDSVEDVLCGEKVLSDNVMWPVRCLKIIKVYYISQYVFDQNNIILYLCILSNHFK